jgi:hypothetical protein
MASEWSGFDLAWKNALLRSGLSALHMAKINWKDEVLVGHLPLFAQVIRTHIPLGFSVAVDAGYFRRMPIHKRNLLGDKDPRDFTFHQLLRLVRDYLKQVKMEDQLSLTFDYEEGFSVDCLKSLINLRKNYADIRDLVKNIAFADDEGFYPLQAADMFAYGYRRHLQKNEPAYWANLTQADTKEHPAPRCIVANFDSERLEDVCAQAERLQKATRG